MKKFNCFLYIIVICLCSCEKKSKGYKLLKEYKDKGYIDRAKFDFRGLGVQTYYTPNSINGPVTYICEDASLNGKIRVKTYPLLLDSFQDDSEKYKDFNVDTFINSDTIKLGNKFTGYIIAEDFRRGSLGSKYNVKKIYHKQFKNKEDTWFTEDSLIFSKIKLSVKSKEKYKFIKPKKSFPEATLFCFQYTPKKTGLHTFEGYYKLFLSIKESKKTHTRKVKFKYKYVVVE